MYIIDPVTQWPSFNLYAVEQFVYFIYIVLAAYSVTVLDGQISVPKHKFACNQMKSPDMISSWFISN